MTEKKEASIVDAPAERAAPIVAGAVAVAPGRQFLGRGVGFWQAAAAGALVACAMALFNPMLDGKLTGGLLPLVMVLAALAIAGPPKEFEARTMRRLGVLAVLACVLLWPLIGAVGAAREREAALLSLPAWAMLVGVLVAGWRFRQQDPDLVLVTFVGAGGLKFLASWIEAKTLPVEAGWWIASAVWVIGVPLVLKNAGDRLGETRPLIGAIGWFVLMAATLTFEETRAAAPLVEADRDGAWRAFRAAPVLGWGWGAFEPAMREFGGRAPSHGAMTTVAGLRMLIEWGVLACAGLGVAMVMSIGATARARRWDSTRIVLLGAAGFWVVALLSSRATPLVPLMALALLWPGVMGQAGRPPGAIKNPDLVPEPAWMGWVAGWLPGVVVALLFAVATLHYGRQKPTENMGAKSFLTAWTQPYRDQAWVVRDRSQEIALYADPRKKLAPIVEAWVAMAPHDEFARIEQIRWAQKSMKPREALEVATEAHARLPWSPEISMWVVRIATEHGMSDVAVRFLENEARERGPLHPALQTRYADLRRKEGAKRKK